MIERVRQTSPEWTRLSKPWDGKDQPPPWPYDARDNPRTERCRHDWPTGWAKAKGERQRCCVHCRRWVWDHAWHVPRDDV